MVGFVRVRRILIRAWQAPFGVTSGDDLQARSLAMSNPTRPAVPALERLARYRPIVPDWKGFMETLAQPLPLCLWTNTLRTDEEDLTRRLHREEIDVRPIPWLPGAFKGKPSTRAGELLPFVAGLCHIQEEVSLLPAALLAPGPGERILDLCAAPGNKTAQLAVAMDNTGTIVANDRDPVRMRAIRGILDRLGIINTTVVTADASNLPDDMGRFDRILADVPCTCEGTTRKQSRALVRSGKEASQNLHPRQRAILRKAVQLCRDDGLIAYATCTYAPEENEMVVDAVLREHAGALEVVPIRLPSLVSSPGLTAWKEHTFDPSLEGAIRIWPHQNDSGGFFTALLRKRRERGMKQAILPVGPGEIGVSDEEQTRWIRLLQNRFGIPAHALATMRLHRPNRRYVAAVASDHRTIRRPKPASIGMPLIRIGMPHPKLSTAGARLLGGSATRNIARTDVAQVNAYRMRKDFVLRADQQAGLSDDGYVLIEHEGVVLGLGLYLEHSKRIRSLLPSSLVQGP